MRKQRQRSSTRSTKSHRSNVHHRNRAASVGRTHDAAIITNASSSSSSNQTTTTTINRIGATGLAGHTIELYGTYGKRRSTGHTQTADHAYQYQNQHHHTAYGSSSHLQSSMVTGATATTGDTSSLDSYAGRSNHAYHESRSSLHKEDTGSMYQSNTTYRSQPGVAQVEATSGNGQQPREMQVSQPLGSLSALSTHGRQHEAIYNIYSSNPYNTYGRSLSRPQQRPSSFCSNASSSSNNLTYAVNTNPAGGSTFYNPNRPSSRMSPIYMNSETRI